MSLREYLMAQINAAERRSDQRFEDMREQVEKAFIASQLAIDKADMATEKRFEGVNEFRAALTDQAARFVTQDTLAQLADKLQLGIERNREDLDALSKKLDIRQGEIQGSRLTWGNMAALLAAFATVIGLLVVAANYLSAQ